MDAQSSTRRIKLLPQLISPNNHKSQAIIASNNLSITIFMLEILRHKELENQAVEAKSTKFPWYERGASKPGSLKLMRSISSPLSAISFTAGSLNG